MLLNKILLRTQIFCAELYQKSSVLRFIDNFSNFVIIKEESKRTFTWLRTFTTPENDALHWDEPTTIAYMQLAFDTAGMW